mmetsp:Transcript_33628/g.73187  ORF Transcript_33628/g.73187 Transcript_33628/m.73187 type:complete len:527 (-) Transcript_33628:126-1706(-)
MLKDGTKVFEIDVELLSIADWRKIAVHASRTCRKPPIVPFEFKAMLEKKHFTNGSTDFPYVAGKYSQIFEEVLGHVKVLDFAGLDWDDEEALRLAKALPFLHSLEHLFLSNNQITEQGARAVVRACDFESPMRFLDLSGNLIDKDAYNSLMHMIERSAFELRLQGGKKQGSTKIRNYVEHDVLIDATLLGYTKLVKGSWLLKHCQRFPRQQDLPEEAYWGPSELSIMIQYIEVVAISYCWLHPVHPDPLGIRLRALKQAVSLRLALEGPGSVHDLAIFLDYMSLPQNGEAPPLEDPQPGESRSPTEMTIFSEALRSVNLWYAHQHTTVWMLKWTPPGMPEYTCRGWPSFEQATASMIKDSRRIFDLDGERLSSASSWMAIYQNSRAGRSPPINPIDFKKVLVDEKVFTNSADKFMVANRYAETFEEVVGRATFLLFSGLGWCDFEAEILAKALPLCTRLQHLVLSNNQIHANGAREVLQASSKCAWLKVLDLRANPIDDDTRVSLLASVKPGISLLLGDGAADEIT